MGITSKGGMRNPFEKKPVHLLAEDLRKTMSKEEVRPHVPLIQGLKNAQAKRQEKTKKINRT